MPWLSKGIHPAHERQQVKQRNLEALEERKRKGKFVRQGVQAYLAEIKPVFALSSCRTQESRIRKYLSPKFDGMPYQALRGYSGYPETALSLRLIALTACRPGEAADAEWDEFDFKDALWRRPAAKMKARRDHVSPLSTQAIAVLKDLQRITSGGSYLFPHRSGKGFTTPDRLTYTMRDMNLAKLGRGTTPHCWRTTFSTWANESGYRPDAIERQLANVESNKVRATYNKALLLDQRKTLLQAWADYLSAAQDRDGFGRVL